MYVYILIYVYVCTYMCNSYSLSLAPALNLIGNLLLLVLVKKGLPPFY